MANFDPIPLNFTPGVVKDKSRRANELGWWDTDKVRFIMDKPQSFGGWTQPYAFTLVGAPRTLYSWFDLSGFQLMGIGTYAKYYIDSGGSTTDITPIDATAALGSNPIATTNLSGIVTVTHASHGRSAGDFVTLSGATAFNNLTTDQLNQEFEILSATINTYDVDTGGAANATSSGGGASVSAEYQIPVGLDTTVVGGGYGAGTWGRGAWDSASIVLVQGSQLRVWSNDNWGEDLLINPRGGAIYYYDTSAVTRAEELSTLSSANETPLMADQILTVPEVRYAIAFGCNPFGDTVADPMCWRWCDQENIVEWEPMAANSAGGNRFVLGSKFMVAVKTRQEIMAFTDSALYAVQHVGFPDYFTQRLVSPNVRIAGPKAAGFLGDAVYWMGTRGFYMYNGQVREVPCPLKEFVFRDINLYQLWKCFCGVNTLYNEIFFFYCSADSEEINRYVMVRIPDMIWVNGTFDRTAWLDNNVFTLPRASNLAGEIFDHETGNDADGAAIESHAETSPFLAGNGQTNVFIKTIWPDIDFLDSSGVPEVAFILKLQNRPGSGVFGSTDSDVVRTVTLPVQTFTDKLDVGKRARMAALRIQSDIVGTQWRLGTPHIEMKPDGRRGG